MMQGIGRKEKVCMMRWPIAWIGLVVHEAQKNERRGRDKAYIYRTDRKSVREVSMY